MAGGPHHTALTTAVSIDSLQDFSVMTGIELLRIDARTVISEYARELRWNQAYYRLAQPLVT